MYRGVVAKEEEMCHGKRRACEKGLQKWEAIRISRVSEQETATGVETTNPREFSLRASFRGRFRWLWGKNRRPIGVAHGRGHIARGRMRLYSGLVAIVCFLLPCVVGRLDDVLFNSTLAGGWHRCSFPHT